MFLNQFEFTRFKNNDPIMKDNEKYVKNFYWLYSAMSFELFKNIEIYLKSEKEFLLAKNETFKDEVCNLVSLEERGVKMRQKIDNQFIGDMFKYRGFSDVIKYLKRDVSEKIKENMILHNITKFMATNSCSNPQVKFKVIEFVLNSQVHCSFPYTALLQSKITASEHIFRMMSPVCVAVYIALHCSRAKLHSLRPNFLE